jgi:ribosomal protein S18 acetylase RimI-like enzyme
MDNDIEDVTLRGAEDAADAVEPARSMPAELVTGGAALGWVEPPSGDEVAALFDDLVTGARVGDAALRLAYRGDRLVGLGYWRRYARPTHRPNADLEKLAVVPSAHGRGIGRRLTAALIEDAEAADVEFLTLDARGDNANALRLYRSLGFTEYGRLTDFVAVGDARYDKVFYVIDLRVPRA